MKQFGRWVSVAVKHTFEIAASIWFRLNRAILKPLTGFYLLHIVLSIHANIWSRRF